MAGENPNAKKLRENDRKAAKGGKRSKASDPEVFGKPEPKSKLHHKGKKKGK